MKMPACWRALSHHTPLFSILAWKSFKHSLHAMVWLHMLTMTMTYYLMTVNLQRPILVIKVNPNAKIRSVCQTVHLWERWITETDRHTHTDRADFIPLTADAGENKQLWHPWHPAGAKISDDFGWLLLCTCSIQYSSFTNNMCLALKNNFLHFKYGHKYNFLVQELHLSCPNSHSVKP